MDYYYYVASMVGLCIASAAVTAAAESWDRPCFGLALCLAFNAALALVIRTVSVSARRRGA